MSSDDDVVFVGRVRALNAEPSPVVPAHKAAAAHDAHAQQDRVARPWDVDLGQPPHHQLALKQQRDQQENTPPFPFPPPYAAMASHRLQQQQQQQQQQRPRQPTDAPGLWSIFHSEPGRGRSAIVAAAPTAAVQGAGLDRGAGNNYRTDGAPPALLERTAPGHAAPADSHDAAPAVYAGRRETANPTHLTPAAMQSTPAPPSSLARPGAAQQAARPVPQLLFEGNDGHRAVQITPDVLEQVRQLELARIAQQQQQPQHMHYEAPEVRSGLCRSA